MVSAGRRRPKGTNTLRCRRRRRLALTERPFQPPTHPLAVHANSDAEGFLEAEKAGLKHYAVRSSGKDSSYRPAGANIAPRFPAWTAPTPAAAK